MEFINDLMTYHFLQNALVTAVVIGIVSGARDGSGEYKC